MNRKQILPQILLLVFLLPAFEASSQSEEVLLAPVKTGGELGYYGYIDKTGKMAIEPQFNEAWDFQEGLARIRMGDDYANSKYGYIDKTGKTVIEPQFNEAGDFQEGLARIYIWSNRGNEGMVDDETETETGWGYIDKTGKMVVEPQFDEIEHFLGGLARIKLDDKWGYIDKTGEIVIKPQFDWAGYFH